MIGRGAIRADDSVWARWTVAGLLLLVILREWLNAQGVAPLQFQEAQLWAQSEALSRAGGYDLNAAFGGGAHVVPGPVALLIRLSTDLGDDTPYALRFLAPVMHMIAAYMIFLSARRLFDAQTGFWAAICYSFLPGVVISAGLMTSDPFAIMTTAVALWLFIGVQSSDAPWRWALMGAVVALGHLADPTVSGFWLGVFGYLAFNTVPSRHLVGVAVVGWLVVLVAWQQMFAGEVLLLRQLQQWLSGLSDNLAPDPAQMVSIFGLLFGTFGPLLAVALLLMLLRPRDWDGEWRYRLLMWFTLPLPLVHILAAGLWSVTPTDSATAFVAGSMLVVAWLLDRDRVAWMRWAVLSGVVTAIYVWGAGAVYARHAADLPRLFDPFKKTRHYAALCSQSLDLMAQIGASRLVSDDRRLLADCMFTAGMTFGQLSLLTARGKAAAFGGIALRPWHGGVMLLVMRQSDPGDAMARFAEAEVLSKGEIRTHADRTEPYVLLRVSGFKGS